MQSVTAYCLAVQTHVVASRPDSDSVLFDRWFQDTGLASNAVTLALESRNAAALQIAEQLADRYSFKGATS
jgi:hypothetical protein